MPFSLKEVLGACPGCGNSWEECTCDLGTYPEDVEGACKECGAPPDAECSPGCPNAEYGEFEPASGVFKKYDKLPEMDEDENHGDHCPDCGAPAGADHKIGCNNDDDKSAEPDVEEPVNVDSLTKHNESINFDKYMDKILVQEGRVRTPVKQIDSPQRVRAAKHQDRPLNKTRFGGK